VTRTRAAVLAAAVALVATAAVVALLVRAGDDGASAAIVKGPHFIDVDTPGVLTLENGDCFRDPGRNARFDEHAINAVECVGADNEVYVYVRLRGRTWDEAALTRQAIDRCRTPFVDLWGSERQSGFAFYPVMPTRRSWTQNHDRSVMCVVYSPSGPLTVDPITRVRTTH